MITAEEKDILKAYATSDVVRVIRSLLTKHQASVHNRLLAATPSELQLIQGELRGLNAALSLIDPNFYFKVERVMAEQNPLPEDSGPCRPLVRNTQRVKDPKAV